MDNLPSWTSKVQAIWVAIGTILIALASQGMEVPDFLSKIFSDAFYAAFIAALGAVLNFFQLIRAIVANQAGAAVKVLSSGDKVWYAINPFKIAA